MFEMCSACFLPFHETDFLSFLTSMSVTDIIVQNAY